MAGGKETATVPEGLPQEIRALLRGGLPVRVQLCGPALLGLSGVRARALLPEDVGSRARALDGLLREQLDRLENAELAPAARLLFGAEATTSGATLTVRRKAAATASGYEVHHFRKRIEPKLAELVAWQLCRDSEEFTARHPAPPELHPASGPLVLPADVFAWEAAGHQQVLATLWGSVYLLRAELLQVATMVSMDADVATVQAAANSALWRYAQVLRAVAQYRATYGSALLDTSAQFGPAEIAASVGWTPDLLPTQELLLAGCGDHEVGLANFTSTLARAEGGPELTAHWHRALTGRSPQGDGPEQEVSE
jgi:hypothetical protein